MKLRLWWLVLFAACTPLKRVPLVQTSVKLDDGRFVGPVEVKVPRHADHAGHDFEVNVRLVAACDPLFTLAFPDGEQQPLGVDDGKWQALLRARAGVALDAPQPTPGPPPPHAAPQNVEPQLGAPPPNISAPPQNVDQPPPMPPNVGAPPMPPANVGPPPPMPPPNVGPPPTPPNAEARAAVDAQVVVPSPTVGRWERTVSERWQGQLEFEAQRARRCGEVRTFTAKYRNAFDDTNTVALWATVPQELTHAELFVEVIELVPPPAPTPVVEARVEAHARVEVKPPKPRPAQPAPRTESPPPAKDSGARWQPGYWAWHDGQDEWVWVGGVWLAPTTRPALRVESPGAPPVPGCGWANGHWVWVHTDGHWEWVGGHWTAPPPLVEDRGEPPDPTAPWISGQWLSLEGTFRWQPGRWGRPQPRAETQPPRPRADAEWIPGQWLFVTGRWVWSAGFWSGTERPPPPRAEVPPPRPHPDAVWLAGFWRWDVTVRTHVWIAGHWELPPGEGFVWVEEKLGPDLILRGHWELRVKR